MDLRPFHVEYVPKTTKQWCLQIYLQFGSGAPLKIHEKSMAQRKAKQIMPENGLTEGYRSFWPQLQITRNNHVQRKGKFKGRNIALG